MFDSVPKNGVFKHLVNHIYGKTDRCAKMFLFYFLFQGLNFQIWDACPIKRWRVLFTKNLNLYPQNKQTKELMRWFSLLVIVSFYIQWIRVESNAIISKYSFIIIAQK